MNTNPNPSQPDGFGGTLHIFNRTGRAPFAVFVKDQPDVEFVRSYEAERAAPIAGFPSFFIKALRAAAIKYAKNLDPCAVQNMTRENLENELEARRGEGEGLAEILEKIEKASPNFRGLCMDPIGGGLEQLAEIIAQRDSLRAQIKRAEGLRDHARKSLEAEREQNRALLDSVKKLRQELKDAQKAITPANPAAPENPDNSQKPEAKKEKGTFFFYQWRFASAPNPRHPNFLLWLIEPKRWQTPGEPIESEDDALAFLEQQAKAAALRMGPAPGVHLSEIDPPTDHRILRVDYEQTETVFALAEVRLKEKAKA